MSLTFKPRYKRFILSVNLLGIHCKRAPETGYSRSATVKQINRHPERI